MKIDFFQTEYGMDTKAVNAGVYHVELVNPSQNSRLSLYVGESVFIAARCGAHLYEFYKNPHYFGLEEEDREDDELTLKFTVLNSIEQEKSVLGVGRYKEEEMKYIREYGPLTQLETSDRQISNEDDKVRKVQETMKAKGFK